MLGDMFASLALEPQHDFLGGFCLINYKKRELVMKNVNLVTKRINSAWSERYCLLGLGRYLFVENGLGLSTVTGLFTVITAFSLSGDAVLTLLVLGDLVESVLPALLALAVGFLGLRNVHLPKTVTKN